jgi:hypothetical protein
MAEEYRQLKIPLKEQGRLEDPPELARILNGVIEHKTAGYQGVTEFSKWISVIERLEGALWDLALSVPLRWEDSEMTLGVFLLDDHEVVRSGLRGLLEAGGDIKVVGEAGTVAEALARIPPTKPRGVSRQALRHAIAKASLKSSSPRSAAASMSARSTVCSRSTEPDGLE